MLQHIFHVEIASKWNFALCTFIIQRSFACVGERVSLDPFIIILLTSLIDADAIRYEFHCHARCACFKHEKLQPDVALADDDVYNKSSAHERNCREEKCGGRAEAIIICWMQLDDSFASITNFNSAIHSAEWVCRRTAAARRDDVFLRAEREFIPVK